MEPATAVTAIVKVASSAVAKMATFSSKKLWERRKTRSLSRALQSRQSDPVSKLDFTSLSASTLESIVVFIESPEFNTFGLKLAARALTSKNNKSADESWESLQYDLRLVLRKYVTEVDIADSFRLADELLSDLNVNILQRIGSLNADYKVGSSAVQAEIIESILEDSSERAGMADRSDSSTLDLGKILLFEKQFKQQFCKVHAKMKLPYAGSDRLVSYEKLFVVPSLVAHAELKSSDVLNRDESLELADFASGSLRSVILGDPGAGKSTLSFKLARDIANGKASNYLSCTVPFVVILRDVAHRLKEHPGTLVAHIESVCSHPYNTDPPQGAVDYLLETGRAFVIFDGLDELVDVSLRVQVVDALHAFITRYPATQVLVTSRRVGYGEAPLDSDLFRVAYLADFDLSKVREYAQKWFSLESGSTTGARKDLVEPFISESEIVSDLRCNPLMLSLMCGIYASENYIPKNRPDIYEKCSTMLFERWDQQRGIEVPVGFNAHIKYAIYALALWLYEDSSRQQGLTEASLVGFVRDYLHGRRFEHLDEAEDAATNFVRFCTGRAWVLTDIGSNPNEPLYGFTHRTFLEYFAARQLVRVDPSPENLAARLFEKVCHAEWDVVCQLVLQVLGLHVDDGADRFMRVIVEQAEAVDYNEFVNVVTYSARALSFSVLRPELTKSIVKKSFRAYTVSSPGSNSIAHREKYFVPLIECIAALPENLPLIDGVLTELLEAASRVEGTAECALALGLQLDTLVFDRALRNTHISSATQDYWRRVTRRYRESSLEAAAGYVGRFGWLDNELLREGQLSPSLVFEKPAGVDAFFKHDTDPLGVQVALASTVLGYFYDGGGDTRTYRFHESDKFDAAKWKDVGYFEELTELLVAMPLPWIRESSVMSWMTWNRTGRDDFMVNDQLELGLLLSVWEAETDHRMMAGGTDLVGNRYRSRSLRRLVKFNSSGKVNSLIIENASVENLDERVREFLELWRCGDISVVADD